MSASNVKKYDVVVLGCGEGGKFIAWTLAKQGMRTVLRDAVITHPTLLEGLIPLFASVKAVSEPAAVHA
jgi:pyruvate/2-oxoglutarate dehydrogenase complex dihydrolipoamide dehydrogenase (E3) component